MGRMLLFGLFCLILLPLVSSALTDNLIFYYKLDETTGTFANNSVGTYNLTATNALPNGTGWVIKGRKK